MPPRKKNPETPCPWHFSDLDALHAAGYVNVTCEHGSWDLDPTDTDDAPSQPE